MNGCAVLAVLCPVVAKDAITDCCTISEDCSPAIPITVCSCLIDTILHNESVENSCHSTIEVAVAKGANRPSAIDNGLMNGNFTFIRCQLTTFETSIDFKFVRMNRCSDRIRSLFQPERCIANISVGKCKGVTETCSLLP